MVYFVGKLVFKRVLRVQLLKTTGARPKSVGDEKIQKTIMARVFIPNVNQRKPTSDLQNGSLLWMESTNRWARARAVGTNRRKPTLAILEVFTGAQFRK